MMCENEEARGIANLVGASDVKIIEIKEDGSRNIIQQFIKCKHNNCKREALDGKYCSKCVQLPSFECNCCSEVTA